MLDNDPEAEQGNGGGTNSWGSVILMEVLRDVGFEQNFTPAEQAYYLKGVTLHEIGHQFLGAAHPPADAEPTDVMWAPSSNAEEALLKNQPPLAFSEQQVATIRGRPKPS